MDAYERGSEMERREFSVDRLDLYDLRVDK